MLLDFKTYNDLINNAQKEFRQKGGSIYYELHHIIPKNMGGTDDKNNLVLLTIGEHVYAHYLLALEYEQNKNHQGYVANIQAAWLVCHGKSKFSNWKKIKLEEWLKDEEAQKISADLKIKFLENKKLEKGVNAGKSFKDGTLKMNAKRIWVQKATQKPVRILERNLGQGSWIGYIKIIDCPICHQANSEISFACCEAHAEEYLKLKKEEYKKQRALDVAKRWEDPEYAKRIIDANTGIAHGSTGIWITNGVDTKMIQESELEEYTNQGWLRGRSGIEAHKQSEEMKVKTSERRKNSCYVKKDGIVKEIKLDELDKYLSEGWTRGTYGTSRKGIIQPPMAWVHNETEIKRIRKANLQEYLDNGWKQGRK